jgi:hypothetical protein
LFCAVSFPVAAAAFWSLLEEAAFWSLLLGAAAVALWLADWSVLLAAWLASVPVMPALELLALEGGLLSVALGVAALLLCAGCE